MVLWARVSSFLLRVRFLSAYYTSFNGGFLGRGLSSLLKNLPEDTYVLLPFIYWVISSLWGSTATGLVFSVFWRTFERLNAPDREEQQTKVIPFRDRPFAEFGIKLFFARIGRGHYNKNKHYGGPFDGSGSGGVAVRGCGVGFHIE